VSTTQRTYTIKEAAQLTGLPASTLRYYETIGITPRIMRGDTSGHRIYTQDDIDLLTWVSCLAATGMSVQNMREYLKNGKEGITNADKQIELLTAKDNELAQEQQQISARREYVQLKIQFWHALAAGDQRQADQVAEKAARAAENLH
jgi:hypothetical protein